MNINKSQSTEVTDLHPSNVRNNQQFEIEMVTIQSNKLIKVIKEMKNQLLATKISED